MANTKYSNGLYILDVSAYQGKADKTTGVDWDTIAKKAPWIIGGYFKLGEVCDRLVSQNEDDFLDLTFKTNVEGARRNHMLVGAYIYLNNGLFTGQMGMDLDDYKAFIKTGKTPEESESLTLARILDSDPQIHLIMRQLKIGFGRTPDYSKIKSMPTRDIHFIVLDSEKWQVYYGNKDKIVPPNVIGAVADVTAKELQWLMDHGYLPQMPILIYSGAWFINQYSPNDLSAIADYYDTICAGYYWGRGGTPTTWDEIRNKYLTQIPDTWKPPLFGGAEKFGKRVDFFQISGDKFQVAEVVNDRGMWSPIDLNYCNFSSINKIAERFPLWTDWQELGKPSNTTPIPDPTPVPIPATKKYAQIVVPSLNVRKVAGAGNPVIDTQVHSGAEYEITNTQTLPNGEEWEEISIKGWICKSQKGITYLNIVEK